MNQQPLENGSQTTSKIVLSNVGIIVLYVIIGWIIMYVGRSGELSVIHSGSSDWMYAGTQSGNEWLSYNKIKEFGSNIVLYGWMVHIVLIFIVGIIKKIKHSKFGGFAISALAVFLIEIVVFIFTWAVCYDSCI